jgi:hypothetical protein
MSVMTATRARNGIRHQERCNRPFRLMQNLSFVIVPLRTIINALKVGVALKNGNGPPLMA